MGMLEKIRATSDESELTWRPEQPGDCIAGTVVDIRHPPVNEEERMHVEILSEEDGEVWVVWATTVLRQEFERKHLAIGDEIGIKYLGQPKKAKRFKVLVDKAAAAPDVAE